MSKEIKVVITDLDGTLLNTSHKISDYTKEIFKELHNQNYLLIVATGRHHLDAMPIIEGLEVPIYLVTSNGARIHSPQKELLFSFDIKTESLKSVLTMDIDPEITVVLFKENVWQTNKINERLNSFQTKMNYLPEVVDFDTLMDYSGIKLFFTHSSHEKLVELRQEILIKHNKEFSHAFSLPTCLEFMDISVDKSVAILKILELENLGFHQTISFGDGFNDEKMLNATGIGLIMANAPQSLKDNLSHLEVILSNDNDGVAKYLSKEILKNV